MVDVFSRLSRATLEAIAPDVMIDHNRAWPVITTRYVGPGNVTGARIIARSHKLSIRRAYDHSLDGTANHVRAAEDMARMLNSLKANHAPKLSGIRYVMGADRASGYVFVRVA